ncbi:adenylyl-sulfate kinase [Lapillicoccus jejuensis]|uniref:adenylyl-sulfate kinase n=1 Tax=Lapillicoccus jejuensis TaxID=402171 RepID=A0A542E1H3_9MICO|nr:adenylyl-sulfate kinase [Lapillicoccus jejuensis]TQJ09182.1 sulfate adenylyltransferase [Lapillicoccus jejuensis]
MTVVAAPPTLVGEHRVLADLELVLDGVLEPGHVLGGPVAPDRSDPSAADRTGLLVPAPLVGPALEGGALVLVDEESTPLGRLTDLEAEPTRPAGDADAPVLLRGTLHRERRRESGAGRALALDPTRPLAPGTLLVVLARPALLADTARVVAAAEAGRVLLVVPDDASDTAGVPTAVLSAAAVRLAARLVDAGLAVDVATAPLARRGTADDARLVDRLAARLGAGARLVLTDDPGLDEAADGWQDVVRALDLGEPTPQLADEDRTGLTRWRRPRAQRGLVVFLTGFSGSGKSTVARALQDWLLEHTDRTVSLLDGDVVRRLLSSGLGFDRASRSTNIRRIGYVAAEVARHGGLAVCAPVAPYDVDRRAVRAMVEAAGGDLVLVHVATPLEECERRDLKGLYAKARAGLVPEFTGISDPYDVPTDADVTLDTTDTPTADAVALVVARLRAGGWIPEAP